MLDLERETLWGLVTSMKKHGVEILVDLRGPNLIGRKGFSKGALVGALRRFGIEYHRAPVVDDDPTEFDPRHPMVESLHGVIGDRNAALLAMRREPAGGVRGRLAAALLELRAAARS
jgi:hypothetical protein